MKTDLNKLLNETPRNWKHWGKDDEIGALNYIESTDILKAISTVKYGKVFTLGHILDSEKENPAYPDTDKFKKFTTQDKSSYEIGKVLPENGGLEFTEETILMSTHGTTHCDALGHSWFNDKMYNGNPSTNSIHGLKKLSIAPIGENGIVGKSVLIDICRYKNLDNLPMDYEITLDDILETAKFQDIKIEKKDIILIRTGILNVFYEKGEKYYFENFNEPGLTYSKKLIKWFDDMEIPVYATDTLTNEIYNPNSHKEQLSLHAALSRNLGIIFIETLDLEKYSKDCYEDKKYDGLFVSSPLKIIGASASPINPLIIK